MKNKWLVFMAIFGLSIGLIGITTWVNCRIYSSEGLTNQETQDMFGIIKMQYKLPPAPFKLMLGWVNSEGKVRRLNSISFMQKNNAEYGMAKLFVWNLDNEEASFYLEVGQKSGFFSSSSPASKTRGKFPNIARQQKYSGMLKCQQPDKDGYYHLNRPVLKFATPQAHMILDPVLEKGTLGLCLMVEKIDHTNDKTNE